MTKKLMLACVAASWFMTGGAMAQKVVTLWHPYNQETDLIHVGIKAFNESQKEYRIEARLVPYTQLTAEMIKAVATGTPPDLVTLNDPVVASFASQDQLVDITDRIKNSKVIDLGLYYKGPQTSGVWKGRRYSIAREVNALALFYNADLFRAKGLDPDKPRHLNKVTLTH